MGFLKGNASFSQFKIDGGAAMPDAADYYQKVKPFAFRDLGLEAKDENVGWTAIDNARDATFQNDMTDGSRYRFFALRIDRRTVPAPVVKIRCAEAEEKKLAETGQRKLYREQLASIREAVEASLKASIPPVPHIYEVVWDVEARAVYFGSLSIAAIDVFAALFMRTFGLVIGTCDSFVGNMERVNIRREFLTWLWFKAEERGGAIALSDLNDVQASIGGRVALVSGDGTYAEQVVCQGEHADLKEGMEALRQGKLIVETRIKLQRDDHEFEFTAYANGYQYKGMRMPPAQADGPEDKAGAALERLYMLEMATDTMGRLFDQFAQVRMSDKWPAEHARMSRWLKESRE